MISRRQFLENGGFALSALWLYPHPANETQKTGKALRYGLFFDENALPSMRLQFAQNPMFKDLREKMQKFDRAKERAFIANEVRYNDQLFHIQRLHLNAPLMAMYYLMTGDKDAAQLSAEIVRTIMKFPKWDYFLEAGKDVIGLQRATETLINVVFCADWLGDFIPEEERISWMKQVGEKGCEPAFRSLYGMRYKDRVIGWSMDTESTYFEHRPNDRIDLKNWPWILDRTNLKAIPAGALATGAVAYKLQFGENADTNRWREQAIHSISTFKELFARDGSYDEGISYANYTATNLARGIELLKRFEGIQLYDQVNWQGFVEYMLGLSMPTQSAPTSVVNFGDAGWNGASAISYWIANNSSDGLAQWHGKNFAQEHNEWSLIWYDPQRKAIPAPQSVSIWHSDLDWIVGRTGYLPQDLVIAMRSGQPSNHEHADRNSIILKCFGEVLIADPMRPPYQYADPSWLMRTSLGHSGLLINGKGHQYHDGKEGTNASKAVAKIVRTTERSNYFAWTSDATPAYQMVMPEAKSVTRTLITIPAFSAVLVLDKVIADMPVSIQARFFGDNRDGKTKLNANRDTFFTIQRPLASLKAYTLASGSKPAECIMMHNWNNVTPNLANLPEETKQRNPYCDVIPVEMQVEPLLISVLVPQAKGKIAPLVQTAKLNDFYRIQIQQGNQKIEIRIFDRGEIPEFEII